MVHTPDVTTDGAEPTGKQIEWFLGVLDAKNAVAIKAIGEQMSAGEETTYGVAARIIRALRSGSPSAPHPSLSASQISSLVKFADDAVQDWADGGGHEDAFDSLNGHGLIVPVVGGFDPERHNGPNDDFLEAGDEYYELAPWLQAARGLLNKAEGLIAAEEQGLPQAASPTPPVEEKK